MFYDIYAALCEKQGKKPSVVARELGINKSNVSNWKNNGYTPRGKVLNAIAEYFGVSTDYLLMGTEFEQKKELTVDKNSEKIIRLDEIDNPDIKMIARAGGKMTKDQAENLRKYAQYMFPEAFEDDDN